MKVIVTITADDVTVDAPPDCQVEIHDYTAPEDWDDIETDADGYTFQRVIVQEGEIA